MTFTSCRDVFQEALKVLDQLVLIRIPFNPYNHMSKEWIIEHITVKIYNCNFYVFVYAFTVKCFHDRILMKQVVPNGSTTLSEILYEDL